jgi:hypothetical protein
MKHTTLGALALLSLISTTAFADLLGNSKTCNRPNQIIADLEVGGVSNEINQGGFTFKLNQATVRSIKCNTFERSMIKTLKVGDVVELGNGAKGWFLDQKLGLHPSGDQINGLPLLMVDMFSKNFFPFYDKIDGWQLTSQRTQDLVLAKKEFFPTIKKITGKYSSADFFNQPTGKRSKAKLAELRKDFLFNNANKKKLENYSEIQIKEIVSDVIYWDNNIVEFKYDYKLEGCTNSFSETAGIENQLVIACDKSTILDTQTVISY